jgi:N-acetylglucosaminyldiphosphoundecaprenol N-acetyl-beta-D-mannosaminyltransferase
MDKVNVLGVHVADVGQRELEEMIVRTVREGRKDVYAYVNIHAVNLASGDPEFRSFLNGAHVAYCDGEGVRVGARFLRKRLPPRIVMTYWIWDLCSLMEKERLTAYFLGGTEGAVNEAVSEVKRRHPGIALVGWHHGYFEKRGNESRKVIEEINALRPHLLFVGFGMPLQEKWIQENFEAINANAILPSGSMIDYTSGRKRLTPAWMARHGLEWAFRLSQEPGRLWKRYVIGNPLFFYKVLVQRVQGGKR